jgi:hypothetical protein
VLDTLKVSRNLRSAGFTEPQADAVIAAVQEASVIDLSPLATKADLVRLEAATKADLLELKADIARLETTLVKIIGDRHSDTLKWVCGLIVASVTINVGAIIALVNLLKVPA